MFLFFLSFSSFQWVSQTDVARAIFTCIKLVIRVRVWSHASNGEDWGIANVYKARAKTPNMI